MSLPDDETRLENLLAQATSLSMVTYGGCGDHFRSMRADHQDNILWLLSDLIHEIETLTRRTVWGEGG